jgi:2,6-dihydroxypseudooxynicotine hydrolase
MDDTVASTIDSNAARMISDGIPYADLEYLKRDIGTLDQWCARWVTLSAIYEGLAEKALARGATLTAGEHLWRAALSCHFGQGILMDITAEEKYATDLRKQKLFQRAAPLFHPPAQRIVFDFEDVVLPGYLRLPVAARPSPCMVIFGGLDTTKEDAFELTTYFLARGIASLTFDGPGQGEVFHRLRMRLDYERAVSAAIDYASARPEIDENAIGVLGRSTGGHWACKAAATDPRIRLAIAWGLIYHLKNFGSLSSYIQKRFLRAASLSSMDEACTFFSGYDLEGYTDRIRCPLLVVQGGRDPIAPANSVELLKAAVPGRLEIMAYPESGHCAHDRAHLAKPAMADFATMHLSPGQSAGVSTS